MVNIFSWLADPKRSYLDGMNLLKSLKPKELPYYSQFVEPDPGSYQFRMLYSVIQNIARKTAQNTVRVDSPSISVQQIKTIVKASKEKKSGIVVVSNPLVDVKELPEDMQTLYFSTKKLTVDIAREHVRLKSAATDDERKGLLADITRMESLRASNWKSIDSWWEENKLPKEPLPTEAPDAKEIARDALSRNKRINTLKINLSRALKELKTMTGKKAEARNLRIEAWNKELNELEKIQ
jgi:hypothetical protein